MQVRDYMDGLDGSIARERAHTHSVSWRRGGGDSGCPKVDLRKVLNQKYLILEGPSVFWAMQRLSMT